MAATEMPLFHADRQTHDASSFIAPVANFTSDSRFQRKMAPRSEQDFNAPRQSRPSISPHATANTQADGGFQFIVGGSHTELKSKKNMTVVRKKAMRSFLANKDGDARKKSTASERKRHLSENSTGSRSSIGNQEGNISTAAHNIPTNSDDRERVRRDTSSSTTPAATSQQTQETPKPLAHMPTVESLTQDLKATTLIELPRPSDDDGRPLPYVREPYPLFVSFGENVDPFKTMFQSSYPRVSVEQMKFFCARFFGTKAMGKHWIPTVLSAPHTFLSTLCCASAHRDAILDRATESVETSLLRQEVIHLISQNMVHPGREIDELNITALIQLIVSEVIGREEISLRINETGLIQMIKMRGGLSQLKMDGYLASTCSWVLLESAILREDRPQDMFVDYCASRSRMTQGIPEVVPESPLYRPRKRYETLAKSKYYQELTLKLLEDIQSMMELFLEFRTSPPGDFRNLFNYYHAITTQYPPVSQRQAPSHDDYKYEAIRITAILQATAIIKGLPLSKALPHASATVLPVGSTFESSSHPMNSPTSPLSPLNPRQNSFTGPWGTSEYAASLARPPPNSYFGGLQTSISSVTNTHSSLTSSVSYQSSSIATLNSSLSSMPGSDPSVHNPRTRPSLLSTTSSPDECDNPFAEWIIGPKRTESTNLLYSLKSALNASNLSEAWQDMAGVLLWIGLTVGAASHNVGDRALEKWYSALSMRASTLLSFQYPEPVHCTMLKMTQIVEALREPDSPGILGPERAPYGQASEKKRRTRN